MNLTIQALELKIKGHESEGLDFLEVGEGGSVLSKAKEVENQGVQTIEFKVEEIEIPVPKKVESPTIVVNLKIEASEDISENHFTEEERQKLLDQITKIDQLRTAEHKELQ